jgi:hypothetical protein
MTREEYYYEHSAYRYRWRRVLADSPWAYLSLVRDRAPMAVLRARQEPSPAHYAAWEAFARFIRRYPDTGLRWETICEYRGLA